ncbi:hypothetical protein KAR91_80400, partial [Candidatus Pacearchaeota archaeon]|nr:hypothetical protein [Candidatus Pacearchaeota archaeon]
MSVFTNFWNSITSKSLAVNRLLKGKMTETYKLNSEAVTDNVKCRNIYHNIDNEYKLSAGMAKAPIDADSSFIGEPIFKSIDDATNEVLELINKAQIG